MTPEEMVRASSGATKLVPDVPGQSRGGLKCTGQWDVSGRGPKLRHEWLFDGNRSLQMIALKVKAPSPGQGEDIVVR